MQGRPLAPKPSLQTQSLRLCPFHPIHQQQGCQSSGKKSSTSLQDKAHRRQTPLHPQMQAPVSLWSGMMCSARWGITVLVSPHFIFSFPVSLFSFSSFLFHYVSCFHQFTSHFIHQSSSLLSLSFISLPLTITQRAPPVFMSAHS